MRRPSPLPTPPGASERTTQVSGAVDDERASERPSAATDEAENATVPIEPIVIPAGTESLAQEQEPAPDSRDVGTSEPTETSDAPDTVTEPESSSTDADPAPVRVSDVWRAARARRRALRAEVRRFTVRRRRRRAMWIGIAGAIVIVIVGTVGAAYSPLFAVEEIDVQGTSTLDQEQVAAALSDQLGTPLPLIDESRVKAALVAFPLVESYSLEARPPHSLVVRVVERTPIGVVQGRAGYTVLDAAGVALSTTETMPAGLPLLTITGGVGSDAFAAAGLVMRSLPDTIRAQVTEVSASTADDVTLRLGGTNTSVMWGGADQSALKAVALETMMKARPPADVTEYDVSSPTAVVVR